MPALKVLIFGDTHIPSRRDTIPKAFYEHIKDARYDMALITGDLVREQDMRKALPPLPRSFIVRGNMDYSSSALNHHEQIQIEAFNVLLLHGTQLRPRGNIHQLWEIAVNVNADIGIHGHTHRASIDVYHDKLFLNPGTITGATGGWGGVQEASFIEVEAMERELLVTMHKSDWEVVKVSRMEFIKDDSVIKQI